MVLKKFKPHLQLIISLVYILASCLVLFLYTIVFNNFLYILYFPFFLF